MAEDKHALVLHLAGTPDPVLIALTAETAAELGPELVRLLQGGDRFGVTAADGTVVAVNFAHVATAHIDALHPMARAYGDTAAARSPMFR